ncbi:MAG: TonB-dependent receptor [Alphaproteobacteria bacterium]|nr:TonB-dependent receptor [Alphaproteobacteria bacterium]
MTRKILFYALLPSFCFAQNVIWMQPIVIYNKKKTPVSFVNSVKAKQGQTVDQGITNHNSIMISKQGGGFQTISLKGVTQDNMQIWVDGMPFQSGASPVFNLGQLQNDHHQNMELESGPMTAQYGMNTFLGRILIETPRSKKPKEMSAFMEAGKYHSFRSGGMISGGDDNASATLQLSRATSAGRVAYAKRLQSAPVLEQGDFHAQNQGASRIDFQKDDTHLRIFARFGQARGSYKTLPIAGFMHALDYRSRENYSLIRCVLDQKYGIWHPTFGVGYAAFKRDDYNVDNALNDNQSQTKMTYLNWDNKFVFNPNYELMLGSAFMAEGYQNQSARFGSNHDKDQQLFLNMGHVLTVDQHQFAVWLAMHNIQKARQKPSVRFIYTHHYSDHLSGILGLGTAYKQPTLFQLHDPFSGNNHLSPERAWGADFSWNLRYSSYSLKQYYFYYKITDKISGYFGENGRVQYMNQGKATLWGMETSVSYDCNPWTVSLDHLYNRSADTQGRRMVKTPMHKFTAGIGYKPFDNATLKISMQHMGGMIDQDPTQNMEKVRKNMYFVNVDLSYDVTPSIGTYAQIQNIFNKKYEFPHSFQLPGLAVTVGLRVKL